MLGALLANIRLPGGREFKWLKSQKERDKLLKDDDEILTFITTFVTSGIADGQSM
jgi:hypothetical protein